MPAVPEAATLPGQQQEVGSLPSIHSASPETMFGALGEGMTDLGKSTGELSDVMAKHAIQVATLNNKAMSDQAYQGYLNDAGKLEAKFQEDHRSVDPATATNAYTDYVGSLEQLRQHYQGTLGNMVARSDFDQDSRRMQGYMIMNGSKTIATGVHTYRETAFNGSQATLAARAAASQDPAEQEDIKQQISNGAYAWGKSEGLSDDAIKGDILRRTSSVDVSIIDQRMKTDPEGAMTYFRQHRAEMTPEHQGALQEQLDSALSMHGAIYAAQAGMASVASQPQVRSGGTLAPNGAPTPAASHTGLTAPMASLTQGIVAAFPGTHPTSEFRTAAQNAAVHGAPDSAHTDGNATDFHIPAGMTGPEFAAQIKARFPQANVLYEGPNAAHSTAPHVHVQLGTHGMAGGGGNGYMPGTAGAQLDQLQSHAPDIFAATDAAANAYAEKWGLDPVMVRYNAEQKVQSDLNRQEYQFRQVEESSKQNLLTALTTPDAQGNMPGDLPTVFAHDPSLRGDFNNLTGSDRRSVEGALRSNSNIMTPNRQQTWENLSGMDSATLLQQNPLDPKLDLTSSQRIQLINQQKHLREQAAKSQEHDAKISTIASNRLIKMGLTEAGIVDTSGQVADPTQYQVFMGRMLQSEQDWMAQHPTHKGPIPDQELVNMATPLLARRGAHGETQVQTPFGSFGVPFTGSEGERAPLIPPQRYSVLHDQFVTQFGYEPTPEQIGQEYQHRRSRGLEQ